MTTDDRAAMIARVQKLMAMSTVDNEHEAALMAEKAQTLIARFNIEQHELERETGKKAEEVVMRSIAWPHVTRSKVLRANKDHKGLKVEREVIDKQEQWEIDLITGISRGFFCDVIWWPDHFGFIGRETDTLVAEQTWASVRNRLLPLVSPRLSQAKRSGWAPNPKKWRRDWLRGAVSAINTRLRERAVQADDVAGLNPNERDSYDTRVVALLGGQVEKADIQTYALMVRSREDEVKEFIQKAFPNVKTAKTARIELNAHAYWDGHEHGENLPLDPALTVNDGTPLPSEMDRRREELRRFPREKLLDRIDRVALAVDIPSSTAPIADLVEWLIEVEFYNLHHL